jgi:DNA (cytosine-5)-methyltransferase 1
MKQVRLVLDRDLIVDNFAGGGGASTGIEAALGRAVEIAINHDQEAVAMHTANHPYTHHYCEDVFAINPAEVTQGQPVQLAWFSPDCKHFSKAKGGKPVSKKIRGLAWIVIKWAKTVRPKVIMLENVEEFETWGPLTKDGMPDPAKKGFTFRRWWRQLENAGYTVDWRVLKACDYGAPTIRKRLFVIARCDGQPIVWPKPTHGPGLLPYRTAAECIDFSIPCPSIFERKKPLADNTLKRIAKGLQRYVIDSASPFIVSLTHHGSDRVESITEPFKTITGAKRGEKAVVTPFIVPMQHANRACSVDEPLQTVTTQTNKFGVVAATLIDAAHSEVSPKGVKRRGKGVHSVTDPLGTVAATGNQALVSAFMVKHYGDDWKGRKATDLREPLPTVMARNTQVQLVTSNLVKLRGDNVGQSVDEPLATVSAQGTHHAEVRAFLLKWYGNEKDGCDIKDPLHTVTAKERFGLATIEGVVYQIVDIGMRMLTPRELYLAQGFPPDYVIDFTHEGKPLTKTAQVRMCGNSVCPPVSAALVKANIATKAKKRRAA